MKLGTYFLSLCLFFGSLSPSFGQKDGCFPWQPYLKNNKEITNKEECNSQKTPYGGKVLNTCWVESKQKCYWVGNPSQCTCLQDHDGQVCNVTLGTGSQNGYCLWKKNEETTTGCDTWRLLQGDCKYPGYKISRVPPTQEDFCRLLGGEVQGDNCVNYVNNSGERQTCSLQDLWHEKCSHEEKERQPLKTKAL